MEAGRHTKLPSGGKARTTVIIGPTSDMTQSFRLNIQNGLHRSNGTDRRLRSAPSEVSQLAVGKAPAKIFVAIKPYQADPAIAPLEKSSKSMTGDILL